MIQQGNRRLAAIMFTDMVGYTALMQENEPLAKRNRDRHRNILKKASAGHNGTILQYYGDGTLVIFNSAIEAVDCAVTIQTELQKKPKIPLRIGLHTGDIVYDDEGIYGDGVNIASRLENLALSGSIFISDKLVDDIKNHPRFSYQSMGKFELKNVKRPVEVFAVTNDGLVVPDPTEVTAAREDKLKSIAVLPFVNMSSDPENEYFSDGITEELLNALAKVDGLQVTARTSSFAFKGQSLDIREIGKALGVKTVLEGSVRKAGNKVRITAQLINIADGYHLWSDTYDRELEDIFEVQDEISSKICNQLREKLSATAAKEKLVTAATRNIEAYNLYLKGIFYQNKWTLNDSRKAIDLLEKAVEMDPDFALPHAELSGVYGFLGATGKMAPKIAYPIAMKHARKANELDDSLAESYLALANGHFWCDWNWKAALAQINEAIKRNPSYAEAYAFKALYLTAFRKYKEAFVCVNIGLQLDPLSTPSSFLLTIIYYHMGKPDKAAEQLERTLAINPGFPDALNLKAWFLLHGGRHEESLALYEKAKKISGNEAPAISGMARSYLRMGDKEKSDQCMQQLLEMEKNQPEISICFYIALIYADLKDLDNMFRYFDKCVENKEGHFVLFNTYRSIFPFSDDPRYGKLMDRLGMRDT